MIGVVGASGFIGGNLMRMLPSCVPVAPMHSATEEISALSTLLIAAPSSLKYSIEVNPSKDLDNILALSRSLEVFSRVDRVILFSTIDVYRDIFSSDEDSETLQTVSYGGNRAFLEERLRSIFPDLKILRICGIYGQGMKKNLVFDIKNRRELEVAKYSQESKYQFVHIEDVIQILSSEPEELPSVINLASEPLAVSEILSRSQMIAGFEDKITYNIRSKYFKTGYGFSKTYSLNRIWEFLDA